MLKGKDSEGQRDKNEMSFDLKQNGFMGVKSFRLTSSYEESFLKLLFWDR